MSGLDLTPEEKDEIRRGWLARRATTGAPPSASCLARHTHKGAYWQIICSCSREPGHPADFHEDASVPVRWSVAAPLSAVAAGPSREWLLARLTGRGVELTDSALALAVAFVDALPRRALTGETLARMQQEREAGVVPPPVDPEAAALGAVLAQVAAEVDQANRKHGRTFPGGVGACGRREDEEEMWRARDAYEAPLTEGGGTMRAAMREEVAEVFAEPAGSPEQARELCQVAAVAVRGMLVAESEVQGG